MNKYATKKLLWSALLTILLLVSLCATAAQGSVINDDSYMQTLNALGTPHAVLFSRIWFGVGIAVSLIILYFLIRVLRWRRGEVNE
jgi:hypothetical protein